MKKTLLTLLFLLSVTLGFSQIVEPVKWQASEKKVSDTELEVTYTATMDEGWHLYGMDIDAGGPIPTAFNYTTLKHATLNGAIAANQELHKEYDPNFEMELTWYVKQVSFVQLFTIDDPNFSIEGNVSFMACNDQSCTNPSPFEFAFGKKIEKATPVVTAQNGEVKSALSSTIYKPVIDKLNETGNDNQSSTSMWKVLLWGLLGGFIALFTPCVWPIIPMTVSFFLKRGGEKSKGKRDAIFYGLAIIVIYLALGLIVTGIFGASALNSLATNAGFNIFFFLLLVLFAVSFFGAFELALPASWSSKIDQKAESTSGMLSILLMAFTLVLVSFSCTGPIIGTLLVEAASGSWLGPAIGMFGFALALALPFSLFAFFPSMLKKMPKSGGWMNTLKVVLGFLELALSLKFLSVADLAYGWGLLDRETFIVLWVVIFALLGLYLLGKIRLPHDDKIEKVSVARLMMAIVSLSYALYLVPGLWGAPLRSASAFAPPLSTQDFNLYENEVHPNTTDYETAIQMSRMEHKPILVDFSGFGCVNCRKMEAAVWTNDKVASKLKNDFILVSLMVDDRTPLVEPITVEENGKTRILKTVGDKNSYIQRYKFGSSAQPFYVIVDDEGELLSQSYVFNQDVEAFLDFLKGVE